MAEALVQDENNTLRILIVGHTGHGKSSTANSLLGYRKKDKRGFVSKQSSKSITTKAESKVETRFGHMLEVVDCPGFADTSGSDDFIKREIGRALFYTLPGFHCVVFVLRPDRITESITHTIESFFDFFGKDVGAYACLVLTHLQDDAEMTEYIESFEPVKPEESGNDFLKNLIKLCEGKVLPIDNCNEAEDREKQVETIIHRIDRMKTENKQSYFSNEMFAAAMEAIDEREKKRMQILEDKKREQEQEEQRREEELRRLQEEKEQIKKEAESKLEKERLRLMEEMNQKRIDLELKLKREKQMHTFELEKLRLERDRERESRMFEERRYNERRDKERRDEYFNQLWQTQQTKKQSDSSTKNAA